MPVIGSVLSALLAAGSVVENGKYVKVPNHTVGLLPNVEYTHKSNDMRNATQAIERCDADPICVGYTAENLLHGNKTFMTVYTLQFARDPAATDLVLVNTPATNHHEYNTFMKNPAHSFDYAPSAFTEIAGYQLTKDVTVDQVKEVAPHVLGRHSEDTKVRCAEACQQNAECKLFTYSQMYNGFHEAILDECNFYGAGAKLAPTGFSSYQSTAAYSKREPVNVDDIV